MQKIIGLVAAGLAMSTSAAFTDAAEAGVNHNGDIKLARELIAVAADAGANYVKFQAPMELAASAVPPHNPTSWPGP